MVTPTLAGRVAIVTGASRGIGAAVARRFGEAGAAVAVSGRSVEASDPRLPGTIHETAAAITTAGGRALAIRADLASAADRQRLVEVAEAELGPVDILVNDAAVTWFQPIAGFAGRRFEVMFEVQVRAVFELAQLVLTGMLERRRGWILNISSGAARHPEGPPYSARSQGGGTVYGMCKAAVERFSTGLAAEVYDSGVAVNALSPSKVVATPGVLMHALIPPGQEDQAEPVELMAEAALALCSGDPSVLTGRIAYSQALLEELGIRVG